MNTYKVDYRTFVTCLRCGEQTELIELYAGSYRDEAYGAPKIHKVYRLFTKCCESEDFEEEITE